MRSLAVLTVKNEAPFLIEWLAHHRAIGFTDFLVFSNDCTDGTDTMLDRLQALGWITHVPNPGPYDEGPQWAALKAADKHPLVQKADWILVCDIDEFVNIQAGDGTLAALFNALPEATAIPLTWRLFGNAGVIALSDALITEQFTRAAPKIMGWPWRAAMFKTLFRNDGVYRKLGVHRPRSPDKARLKDARWFDGSGRPLNGAFLNARIFSDYGRDNYQLVQLNHYALGSMESYLLKCDRGRANRDVSAFDMSYWVERNFSTVEDRSVARVSALAAPLRAELHADPALHTLHSAAVDWRRARLAQLLMEEPYRALLGRLLLCPASEPLDETRARMMADLALRARD